MVLTVSKTLQSPTLKNTEMESIELKSNNFHQFTTQKQLSIGMTDCLFNVFTLKLTFSDFILRKKIKLLILLKEMILDRMIESI